VKLKLQGSLVQLFYQKKRWKWVHVPLIDDDDDEGCLMLLFIFFEVLILLDLEIGLFNRSGDGIGMIDSLVLAGDSFWEVLGLIERDGGIGFGGTNDCLETIDRDDDGFGDVLGLIDRMDGVGVDSVWDFSEIKDCDDESV
jgi:hypothetical protein